MHYVSNHALERYLERICDLNLNSLREDMKEKGYLDHELSIYLAKEHEIDVEELRAKAFPPIVRALDEFIGDTSIIVKHGGHKYVIKNRTLVTILPASKKRAA
jgi:hypothetical protein